MIGFCAPGYHNGLIRALNEIAQRGGGIGHGIGAVAYDKAVIARVIIAQSLSDGNPVRRCDIGAVKAEEGLAVDTAERAYRGDIAQQLLRGKLRGKAVGRHFGGDGAAGAEHEDVFHIG